MKESLTAISFACCSDCSVNKKKLKTKKNVKLHFVESKYTEEQISNNLKKFAENRPDIFEKDQNTTTSSTSSAAAAAAAAAATISKKKTSVVWDGRTGSIAQVQEAAW